MSARSRIALPALAALALFAAAPARAQDASPVPPTVSANATEPSAAPTPAGPTMQSASIAVRHQEDVSAPAARRGNSTPGTALMIVGGAAIVVGLVVGGSAGNAIAVGGAVAGLIGLYQYLQ